MDLNSLFTKLPEIGASGILLCLLVFLIAKGELAFRYPARRRRRRRMTDSSMSSRR